MFERYSEQAKTTILTAKREACQLGYPEINVDHILLALLNDDGTLRRVMSARSAEEMRDELVARMGRRGEAVRVRDIPLNPDARRVLSFAIAEADGLNNERIGNEHLLLGILRAKKCDAARLLVQRGVTIQGVRSSFASPGEQTRVRQGWKALWRSLVANMRAGADEEPVLLRRISQLVANDRGRDALKLLDDFMAEPVEDSIRRIKNFAPHAAAIAYGIGDFPLVKKYCELALTYGPDSLLSLYLMAAVFHLQGEHEQARRYAIQCYQLAAVGKDPMSQGIVELIERQFPDLGSSLPASDL